MSSIPSSVMPHAIAAPEEPAKPETRSPFGNLIRIAAAPAITALGIGAFAVTAIADAMERRQRNPANIFMAPTAS